MTTSSSQYLSSLRNQMEDLFNMEDVRMLCFNLGIDFENVAGETKSARIRDLILQLANRNRLPELLVQLRQERPHADWADLPADFDLSEAPVTAETVSPTSADDNDDVVGSDKVMGDSITVGNITGATGVAIGSNASATVKTEPSSE